MNRYTSLSSLLCNEFHHLSRDFALFTDQNMAYLLIRYSIIHSANFSEHTSFAVALNKTVNAQTFFKNVN